MLSITETGTRFFTVQLTAGPPVRISSVVNQNDFRSFTWVDKDLTVSADNQPRFTANNGAQPMPRHLEVILDDGTRQSVPIHRIP